MIQIYSRVRLLSTRFRTEGVDRGAIGYVIEVYPDGNCEVEFSGTGGVTIAQIVASADELEVAEPSVPGP